MGAEAELLILPEIAMTDLKRSLDRLDKAMAASAKRAGKEFEEEMEKGIAAGMKRGFRRAGSAAQRGFDGIGGGRGIMGAMAASIAAGFGVAIARADAGSTLVEGRLGEGEARHLMASADMLGLDAGTMASLASQAKRAGFDDMRDFVDILSNIQLKVTEAEKGEDPTLNQFKGLSGADLYMRVLGSLANASNAEAMLFLDKLEAGERLPEMASFLNEMRGGAGGGMVKEDWLRLSKEQADAGLELLKQEQLESRFREEQLRVESERRTAELAAINQGTIKAWAAEQSRVTNEHVTLLKTYEQNLSAAVPMRHLMETMNTTLATIAHNTAPLLNKDAGMVQNLQSGNYEAAWDQFTNGGFFQWPKRGG